MAKKTLHRALPSRSKSASILCLSLLLSSSCAANPELQSLGQSLLTSAGLSHSQAASLFSAGEHSAKAAEGFTEEEEYYLGRSVSAHLLGKYRPHPSTALNDYVSRVGTVLVIASDRPEIFNGYRFQVLDSTEINAFAAPGGFVFVTSGFLKLLPDEDALAAVIAHEIAHIVNNDGIKAISGANFSKALSILGRQVLSDSLASQGVQGLGELTVAFEDSVGDIVSTLAINGYSRTQEYAADAYATRLLQRAGYRAEALDQVLTLLAEKEAEGSSSGGMFSTHPAAEERRKRIAKVLPEKAQPAESSTREERFKQAVRGL